MKQNIEQPGWCQILEELLAEVTGERDNGEGEIIRNRKKRQQDKEWGRPLPGTTSESTPTAHEYPPKEGRIATKLTGALNYE